MNVEEYLSNFYKGTKITTLKAMNFFLDEFKHPEKELKIIHIAGTNGKGSCTEMINNILINAGYKVGKFIGPHLIKYNERISIQNKDIADEDMEKLITKIKPKIDKYNSLNDSKVTLFELETIMAILYFKQNNCDFVVLETGLGGLNDCTNVVNPLISIITSVGFDHMRILGNTLTEIAEKKAGIIKENSDTIYVQQKEEEVNNTIAQTCNKKNNLLHLIEKEDISNYSYNKYYQQFDYKNYKNIQINLKGEKQVNNASIAIECTEILNKKSYNITEQALRNGLKTVIHKGRFEIINNNPLIIYDGAHNKPAIENFMNSVFMYYKENKRVYIISILRRKDYKSMLEKILEDKESIFIFTEGKNEKSYVPKEELYNEAKKYIESEKLYIENLDKAISQVKEKYKNYVTFIVGTFHIYSEVIKKLNNIER